MAWLLFYKLFGGMGKNCLTSSSFGALSTELDTKNGPGTSEVRLLIAKF